MAVESAALGFREIAITDLPSTLGSWPAICTTTPLAPAIDPNTMKARASPALRRKVDDRQEQSNSAEPMANSWTL
jgi:hypothetical protein